MIDYSECTKEELIELVEQYASNLIERQHAWVISEPTKEEIYNMLKGDSLKVKYIESENSK